MHTREDLREVGLGPAAASMEDSDAKTAPGTNKNLNNTLLNI